MLSRRMDTLWYTVSKINEAVLHDTKPSLTEEEAHKRNTVCMIAF